MGEKNLTKRQVSSRGGVGAFLRDRYLAVDPRWLGVFRIYLGLVLLADFVRRWGHARELYSNDGVLPNHYSLFAPMGKHVFSIFHAFSTYGEVSVLFAFATFSAACLTVGYRTRLFHVICAVLVTSVNARNIFVENGGTVVTNILVVWTAFLPLGTRLSVDAVRRSLRAFPESRAEDLNDPAKLIRDDRQVASLAVLALLLQWSIIYFFNTVHKTGEGWTGGSAIWWFWQQDRIATPFAIWARENVPFEVVRIASKSTLWVEGLMPLLLLWPFWHRFTRPLALLLAIGLHGGIALSARLGPFSYVMAGFFLAFLTATQWEWLSRWFAKPARAKTVIYDSDCGVCFLVCRILRRLDPFGRLRFIGNHDLEALPESVDRSVLDRTAVVVDSDGRAFTESRAVFEAGRALPGGILFVFWTKIPGLSVFADWGYRRFAASRMSVSAWLGLGACGVGLGATEASPASGDEDSSEPERYEPDVSPARREALGVVGVVREGIVAIVLVACGSQAAIENPWLAEKVRVNQPEWMAAIVGYPRIYQGWKMFAPEPPFDDGRLVVDGRTADGRKLDPLTGTEPEFDPHTTEGWGHSQLWCDYHNRIRFPHHAGYRQHLRTFLTRHHEFTGRPRDRLVAFDVWWIHDRSPSPGEKRGQPLRPQKIISQGRVVDSGATEWLAPPQGGG